MAHGKTKQTTATTPVKQEKKRNVRLPLAATPEGFDKAVIGTMNEHETKAFREALGKTKSILDGVEGGDEVIGAVPATVKLIAKFKGDKEKLNELLAWLRTAASIYAGAMAGKEVDEIFGIS